MSGPQVAPGLSIAAARRSLAAAFRAADLDTPELDARVLLQAELGLDHTGLIAAQSTPLDANQAARITALAARRLAHEPVARIVGVKEFWGLPLDLGAGTLVPRPETETVVEAALALLDAEALRTGHLRIADLGTGSGALLLALLSELPHAFGIGTDVNADALSVAAANAGRLALGHRARFIACDFAAGLGPGFDLVVSNPPYIESGAIPALPPEVREHDPHLALDGGPDGLAAYRVIAADAGRILRPGGWLVLELGAGQQAAVESILTAAGMTVARPVADLAGIPRALAARRGAERQS
jgi:release factor glutamine methyltransferase